MADHQNSGRFPNDFSRGVSSGTPAPHNNDPLAELARLIGQNDPFAEYGRQQQARQNMAAPVEPVAAPASSYPNHPTPSSYGTPQRYEAPQPQVAAAYGQPTAATEYPAEGAYSYAQAHGYPPGLVPPEVDRHLPELLGNDQQQYYTDDPEAEAMAEREVASRRRKVMIGAAALVLVILGISGAVAYRVTLATYGSSPPPVIKADTAPSKVMAAQRDSNNGKPIQDRLGNNPSGERMVSREEQPVDIKPAPRVVLPQPGGQSVANAGEATTVRGGAEPKKIRTVSIRPDNTFEQPPAAAPGQMPAAAAPTRVASVVNVPAVPAPASVVAQPRPAAPPSVPVAHSQSRGPLSLSPDAQPAAPAPTRTASVPPPRAAAPVAGSGAFVQLSSQRSEADAQAAFRSLQGKYPSVLGNRSLTVHRADLGAKGIYYRAMVGPLASAEAVELCTSLKSAGGSCIIQKN